MSYLTLDADRLVRDAVDAYLEGRMRPDTGGDSVFATRNSQYRVVEGLVHEASDTSLVGAELVGWLVEEMGQPMIEALWRPYGRAIFVERRSRHVVVTSRTLTRNAISGKVSAVPTPRRRPSVIPAAPPIPVLRSNQPPPPEATAAPFRMAEALKEAALTIEAHDSYVPADNAPDAIAPNERPTKRPPSDEATIAADRSSYDELLEASRTPTWNGEPFPSTGSQPTPSPRGLMPLGPPPAPSRPVHLPPVAPPAVPAPTNAIVPPAAQRPPPRKPPPPPPRKRAPDAPPSSSRVPEPPPSSSRAPEPPPSSRRPPFPYVPPPPSAASLSVTTKYEPSQETLEADEDTDA